MVTPSRSGHSESEWSPQIELIGQTRTATLPLGPPGGPSGPPAGPSIRCRVEKKCLTQRDHTAPTGSVWAGTRGGPGRLPHDLRVRPGSLTKLDLSLERCHAIARLTIGASRSACTARIAIHKPYMCGTPRIRGQRGVGGADAWCSRTTPRPPADLAEPLRRRSQYLTPIVQRPPQAGASSAVAARRRPRCAVGDIGIGAGRPHSTPRGRRHGGSRGQPGGTRRWRRQGC